MKRIAIDMDEVMADTLGRKLEWYERDFGIKMDPATTRGQYFNYAVPEAHQPIVKQYARHSDFFDDLKINENCQAVIQALQAQYEIFIVTAAITYPNSFLHKKEWLEQYFPFINMQNVVYCGRKDMIIADYLIDDQMINIHNFKGESIIYTAPHNYYEKGYQRVNNWKEIAELFL